MNELPHELERLTEGMRAQGLDFVLLTSPANVTYAAGFEAPLPVGFAADLTRGLPAVALVAADGAGALLVSDVDAGAAGGSWLHDIRTFETLGHEAPADPGGSFARGLAGIVREAGVGPGAVVGVEATLPFVALTPLEGVELRDAAGPVEWARLLKTQREIEFLRRAVAIADEGQRRLLEVASKPATDVDLWAEPVRAMEQRAGRILAVSGAIVTGDSTADWTTGGPVGRDVQPGEPVLLDIGPRVGGYWADCANTVVLAAEPTPGQRRYLTASREACLEGIDALRPGRRCSDAWHAVRAALERHGIPMSHYAGHQLGTSVNEGPRLLPYDDTVIEAGMVFALEAGAYEGHGGTMGARSEKVALVTETGPEILSAFPWEV